MKRSGFGIKFFEGKIKIKQSPLIQVTLLQLTSSLRNKDTPELFSLKNHLENHLRKIPD